MYRILCTDTTVLKITGYRTVKPNPSFDLHYHMGRGVQTWFAEMHAPFIGMTSHHWLQWSHTYVRGKPWSLWQLWAKREKGTHEKPKLLSLSDFMYMQIMSFSIRLRQCYSSLHTDFFHHCWIHLTLIQSCISSISKKLLVCCVIYLKKYTLLVIPLLFVLMTVSFWLSLAFLS